VLWAECQPSGCDHLISHVEWKPKLFSGKGLRGLLVSNRISFSLKGANILEI